LALVFSELAHEQFMSFVSKYGKKYNTDEEFISRFQIFKSNLKIIAEKKMQNTLVKRLMLSTNLPIFLRKSLNKNS